MKQFWSNNIFCLIAILATLSCAEKDPFKEKYGKEVKSINSARVQSKQEKKEVMNSSPPSEEEWKEMTKSEAEDNKYSYVDVEQFAVGKKYMPDKDYYDQMKAYNPSNMVSRDLFVVQYNTVLSSKFRQTGAEFDRIKNPPYDAYGIKATLSQKPYILVGNNALQNSLDIVDNNRSISDVKISKILIKEKKDSKISEDKSSQNLAQEFNPSKTKLVVVTTQDAAKDKTNNKKTGNNNSSTATLSHFFSEKIIKN